MLVQGLGSRPVRANPRPRLGQYLMSNSFETLNPIYDGGFEANRDCMGIVLRMPPRQCQPRPGPGPVMLGASALSLGESSIWLVLP